MKAEYIQGWLRKEVASGQNLYPFIIGRILELMFRQLFRILSYCRKHDTFEAAGSTDYQTAHDSQKRDGSSKHMRGNL
jgi:hypothetical protein